jgi:hypothetical protein
MSKFMQKIAAARTEQPKVLKTMIWGTVANALVVAVGWILLPGSDAALLTALNAVVLSLIWYATILG